MELTEITHNCCCGTNNSSSADEGPENLEFRFYLRFVKPPFWNTSRYQSLQDAQMTPQVLVVKGLLVNIELLVLMSQLVSECSHPSLQELNVVFFIKH